MLSKFVVEKFSTWYGDLIEDIISAPFCLLIDVT